MTNLIATKASLSGNNSFTGTSNTFSNLPYYINTTDQLINKAYTFTGSNNFNSDSGNIINRLFSTILSVNTGNTRRSVANYFECAMGGKFGSIMAQHRLLIYILIF